MAERAIPPLMTAVTLGFAVGMIAAMLRLEPGAQLSLGIVGAAVTALTALPTLFRHEAGAGDRLLVTLLRAGLAVAVFIFIYAALRAFLLDTSPIAFVWAAIAVINGLLLSRLTLRERPPAH